MAIAFGWSLPPRSIRSDALSTPMFENALLSGVPYELEARQSDVLGGVLRVPSNHRTVRLVHEQRRREVVVVAFKVDGVEAAVAGRPFHIARVFACAQTRNPAAAPTCNAHFQRFHGPNRAIEGDVRNRAIRHGFSADSGERAPGVPSVASARTRAAPVRPPYHPLPLRLVPEHRAQCPLGRLTRAVYSRRRPRRRNGQPIPTAAFTPSSRTQLSPYGCAGSPPTTRSRDPSSTRRSRLRRPPPRPHGPSPRPGAPSPPPHPPARRLARRRARTVRRLVL